MEAGRTLAGPGDVCIDGSKFSRLAFGRPPQDVGFVTTPFQPLVFICMMAEVTNQILHQQYAESEALALQHIKGYMCDGGSSLLVT